MALPVTVLICWIVKLPYPQLDILYYACGGGMGHVNRCAAILRKLKDKRVLAVSSTPQIYPLFYDAVPYVNLAGQKPHDVRNNIRWLILNYNPKIIVMDTFPHGVTGEMENIINESFAKKILVTRYVKPEIAIQWQETVNKFDMVISIEKPVQYKYANVTEVPPVLIRDATEISSAEESRHLLNVYDNKPVIAAISSGDFAWEAKIFGLFLSIWQKSGTVFHPRLISPNIQEKSTQPLIEYITGIDMVIGAAGYNLFHEVKATKTPAIFMPQPKRFDDQYWRARKSPTPHNPEEFEEIIMNTCQQQRKHDAVKYINGATKAAELIKSFL